MILRGIQAKNWKRLSKISAGILIFFLAIFSTQNAKAHGELLIRIAALTKQIEAATNNLAALHLQRGELYREDENWSAAEMDYNRAEELGAKSGDVDFCRAKMLSDSGQFAAARAMFDSVIERFPNHGEAFIGRARVFVKLEQRAAAIAGFRRGLELVRQPKPEFFLELAQNLIAEGQKNEALRALDAGIRKLGTDASLQSAAIDLELESRNFDAALARVQTIIEQSLRKETWLTRRGEILLMAGRKSEAHEAFEAALTAIEILPKRLQEGPPLQSLKSRIEAGLAEANP